MIGRGIRMFGNIGNNIQQMSLGRGRVIDNIHVDEAYNKIIEELEDKREYIWNQTPSHLDSCSYEAKPIIDVGPYHVYGILTIDESGYCRDREYYDMYIVTFDSGVIFIVSLSCDGLATPYRDSVYSALKKLGIDLGEYLEVSYWEEI